MSGYSTFYNLDDVYNDNNDMDKLDKLARDINNKKKSGLIKSIHQDIYNHNKKASDALNYLNDPDNAAFRYFSTQGMIDNLDNKENNLKSFGLNDLDDNYNVAGTNVSDLYKNSSIDNSMSFNSSKSNGSFSDLNFSINDNKVKKNNKNKSIKKNLHKLQSYIEKLKEEHNSHVELDSESIMSTSEDSIIKHLKQCMKCKNKLRNIKDKSHKHIDLEFNLNKEEVNSNNQNKEQVIKLVDLKEWLIILLLVLVVLFIIYVFFKF